MLYMYSTCTHCTILSQTKFARIAPNDFVVLLTAQIKRESSDQQNQIIYKLNKNIFRFSYVKIYNVKFKLKFNQYLN